MKGEECMALETCFLDGGCCLPPMGAGNLIPSEKQVISPSHQHFRLLQFLGFGIDLSSRGTCKSYRIVCEGGCDFL